MIYITNYGYKGRSDDPYLFFRIVFGKSKNSKVCFLLTGQGVEHAAQRALVIECIHYWYPGENLEFLQNEEKPFPYL